MTSRQSLKEAIRTRKFTIKDVAPALKIIRKTLGKFEADRAKKDLYLLLKPMASSVYPKNKPVRLKDTSYMSVKTRVATLGGKVIAIDGIYRLDTYRHGIEGIDWFAVAPRYQHRGVGTKLMKWAMKEAELDKDTVLLVWATKKAEPFYEKFGFERSKMKIAPHESEILLTKRLR